MHFCKLHKRESVCCQTAKFGTITILEVVQLRNETILIALVDMKNIRKNEKAKEGHEGQKKPSG